MMMMMMMILSEHEETVEEEVLVELNRRFKSSVDSIQYLIIFQTNCCRRRRPLQ
jgi:hypothetical protein